MASECDCSNKEQKNSSFSRREFIRTSGVMAAGAVLTAIPSLGTRLLRNQFSVQQDAPPEDLAAALNIATADEMVLEALKEMENKGFGFEFTEPKVTLSSSIEPFVGFFIPHDTSVSKRFGAGLTITVDISNVIVNAVQMIVNWSLVEMLLVKSKIFDLQLSPYLLPNSNFYDPFGTPTLIRPSRESDWFFPRMNYPVVQPDDLVMTGWPPGSEIVGSGYWHFGVAKTASWINIDTQPTFLIKALTETLDGVQERTVMVDYSWETQDQ